MSKPDIILILADDMGFSDLGCYGGEIDTPNLDRLGRAGVRFTQFYNSPRCSPSRASLLTGQHPHRVGLGILNFDDGPDGYPGNLAEDCATVAECLKGAGYRTYLSGKWHLASDMENPNSAWPTRRGFDRFYGTLEGAGSFYDPRTLTRDETAIPAEAAAPGFYYTDAISDNACAFVADHVRDHGEAPYLLYLAHTAPHWPLHARPDAIAAYAGRFDAGWDALREARLARLVDEGILSARWSLTDRDPRVPAWNDAAHKDWEARRMEVYAAQVTAMDAGIGRLLDLLEAEGRLGNTLILFLSDNGGCAEELDEAFVTAFVPLGDTAKDGSKVVAGNIPGVMPGGEDSYASYGRPWANLSNAPFREYKHWVHEGGVATPLIAHWPDAWGAGLQRTPFQLVDVLPTLLAISGAPYPAARADGTAVAPLPGRSMLAALRGDAMPHAPLFWEHEGNAGVREGDWKLVRKYGRDWELYDMAADRTELTDLSAAHRGVVASMAAAWDRWAAEVGVIRRETVLAIYAERGRGLPPE